MSNAKKTCGPMYEEALRRYTSMDPGLIGVFAAGFISGQAEKVYLGACRGAMFRPSADRWPIIMAAVMDVVNRYGLKYQELPEEIWILRDDTAVHWLAELSDCEPNSPRWHRIRARLCGVPLSETDEQFHLRSGHGERCD
jgi:hypothetical protein